MESERAAAISEQHRAEVREREESWRAAAAGDRPPNVVRFRQRQLNAYHH